MGNKDEKKPNDKVASKDKVENEEINCHPPGRSRMQTLGKDQHHSVAQLYRCFQFNLFGHNIPEIDKDYERQMIENKAKSTFKEGISWKSHIAGKFSFKVEEKLTLGPNTFIVSDVDPPKTKYFLKAELDGTTHDTSTIQNDIEFLKNAARASRAFTKHFLKLVVESEIDDFRFMVTRLGGPNLLDIRKKLKPPHEFSPKDAVRLCMQTLQAIHDVHLCRFIHRDIQPKNFLVGMTEADQNIIYVVNFGLSYEYHTGKSRLVMVPKYASLSRTFQPRAFHIGRIYYRTDDMESWMYLCFWFFNSKILPWRSFPDEEERSIYNLKKLFFNGTYDGRMSEKLGPNISRYLLALRQQIRVDVLAYNLVIDFLFYSETLLRCGAAVDVDWKAPFNWNSAKSKNAPSSELPKVVSFPRKILNVNKTIENKKTVTKEEGNKKDAKEKTTEQAEDSEEESTLDQMKK